MENPVQNSETKLPDSVSHITAEGKEFFLLGTAHISRKSVNEVKEVIEAVKPDSVCVELCEGRYKTIMDREQWKKMNIIQVIRKGKAMLLLSSLIMSSFQRRLGEKLGVMPGAEMIEGIKIAKETGAKLVLADRDVQVTLKRTWHQLGLWGKIKMYFQLPFSLFLSSDDIDEKTVDDLKNQDEMENVLFAVSKEFPGLKRALIDERDIYLSQKIREAPGKKIVAVLGAGHLPGVVKEIKKISDLAPLVELPPPSYVGKFLKWGIPLAIIALFVYGFFMVGAQHSVESIYIWVLINGILAALGALIAFGHPVTVFSAFVAAPLTSLKPMIAAGWVSGLVQAWVKKPTVANLETLHDEITTVKGFWTNPVTRILLVVVLSNVGSSLGTLISGSLIASRLF
jgi:pheromone shutdown-related protein TraB